MEIQNLTTKAEMLKHIGLLQQLYPELSLEKYGQLLDKMLNKGYQQVVVWENEVCIALSGYWIGTKMWCGSYLEMDNIIVHEQHRNCGAGKLMAEYLEDHAKSLGCTVLCLDAYTSNFKAHRFYYNQGYSPKGFHFVKVLDKESLT